MSAHESVVFALLGSRERSQTAQFAVGAELVLAPCQYLVSVSLVPHVPYNAVVRRVIDIVQGHRNLCDAKAGSQVPGID